MNRLFYGLDFMFKRRDINVPFPIMGNVFSESLATHCRIVSLTNRGQDSNEARTHDRRVR